eukprot:7867613-Pyramimonas_sp.AAC.1
MEVPPTLEPLGFHPAVQQDLLAADEGLLHPSESSGRLHIDSRLHILMACARHGLGVHLRTPGHAEGHELPCVLRKGKGLHVEDLLLLLQGALPL